MAQKRRGLGRGLEALIPDSQKESASARRPSDVFFPDSRSQGSTSASSAAQETDAAPAPKEERSSGSDLSTLLTPPKRTRGSRSRRTTAGTTAKSRTTTRRTTAKTPVSRETGVKGNAAEKVEESAEAAAPVEPASPVMSAAMPSEPITSPEPVAPDSAAARQAAPAAPEAVETPPAVEPEPSGEAAAENPPEVDDVVDAAEVSVSRETADEASEDDIDDTSALVPVPGASFAELPVEFIHPNPRQPRQVFDEDDIAELAASIREVGLLQPIVVRRAASAGDDEPRYELIMGERRLRASKEAGMETIPAVVRDTDDVDLLRDALLENLHRVQLNPLEEAAAYQQLLEDFHCTHAELSERIARSRSQISNTLRLMKLPPLVQRRLAAGVISAGHARALLGLPNAAVMERLAQRIVAEGLSVRATEELVALQEEPEGGVQPKTLRARSTPLPALSTRLSDAFDTRVKVTRGAKKGRITIEFAGEEDLARIVDALAPGTSLDEE
ncbi:ParB/RepB/Spo0J family partition protein [Actinomyces bowdenii]|uniref:ParB/RepB/Spo0J family partition protein n=1 Tax=Actinomyces bowdenii TaxID=131109 RepID=A0A853EHF3_9ACTO|nr:ParB/RepB/Spo0J family partition protein [Actinomyces bowdenii]MBF0696585.1 ParB/RepB/Spo0J family partition protein [Actinomyces bowdenii]NYS68758.1 ParB/RepB/Spo0J family partition protein [Actinomyces bowdenii]